MIGEKIVLKDIINKLHRYFIIKVLAKYADWSTNLGQIKFHKENFNLLQEFCKHCHSIFPSLVGLLVENSQQILINEFLFAVLKV